MRLLDINDFKQAIALLDREVVNRAVSSSAAARNVLYNYKTFNPGVDLTTKITVNLTCNGVLNKA
jgi:hypothetical protein